MILFSNSNLKWYQCTEELWEQRRYVVPRIEAGSLGSVPQLGVGRVRKSSHSVRKN